MSEHLLHFSKNKVKIYPQLGAILVIHLIEKEFLLDEIDNLLYSRSFNRGSYCLSEAIFTKYILEFI